MIFLLKCPKCLHNMKYHTNTRILTNKRKKCVYCGRSFKVSKQVIKEEK